MAAAHGGQILVSDTLLTAVLPAGLTLRPLGSFALAGIHQPVELARLDAPGLPVHTTSPRAASTDTAGSQPEADSTLP
jgi:class 3 adenylate cyclase